VYQTITTLQYASNLVCLGKVYVIMRNEMQFALMAVVGTHVVHAAPLLSGDSLFTDDLANWLPRASALQRCVAMAVAIFCAVLVIVYAFMQTSLAFARLCGWYETVYLGIRMCTQQVRIKPLRPSVNQRSSVDSLLCVRQIRCIQRRPSQRRHVDRDP
jgi:amino acid transporter